MQAAAPSPPGRRRRDVMGVGRRRRRRGARRRSGPRVAGRGRGLSRTRAAAPSGITKPSRRTSNGRDTPEVDSAVMLAKAAMPTGVIAASAPPPMATSQRPVATRRAAAAREWVPGRAGGGDRLARAVPAGAHRDVGGTGVGHHHGDEEGEIRRGPFSAKAVICCSRVSRPPTPVPKTTPARSGSAPISPASVRPCRRRPPRTGRNGRRAGRPSARTRPTGRSRGRAVLRWAGAG